MGAPGVGAGRGAPGTSGLVRASGRGASGVEGVPGGSGCRGPEITWPGRYKGTSRPEITFGGAEGAGEPGEAVCGRDGALGFSGAGCEGCAGRAPPNASGGRSGIELRFPPPCNSSVVEAAGALSTGSACPADAPLSCAVAAGSRSGKRSRRSFSGGGSASCSSGGSSSATAVCDPSPARRCSESTSLWPKRCLMAIATSSSMELECVFFSSTPSSGSMSRMMLGFTSSSRASSLIRILDNFIGK